jgi:hypothetical protein
MKKKFGWGVLILVIVYGCLWFVASRVVESKVYAQLDRLKQEGAVTEYEGSIYITGFPFSFNINLAHPRVKFQNAGSGYNVNCDMLFDGVLTVELGFFSDRIMIRPFGDLHLKGNLNRYNFNSTIGGKNSYYHVRLTNSLILSAIKGSIGAGGKDAQELLMSLVDKVRIHNEELSLVNKLNNKLLLYADEIDLKVGLDMDEKDWAVSYAEKLSNLEVNAEFNALAAEVLSLPFIRVAVNNLDSNVRNYFDVFSFDKLGKINHEIDLEIKAKEAATSIKINKLSLKDAAYNLDASGTIGLGDTTKIDLDFTSKFSERWYRLMGIYADRLQLGTLANKSFGVRRNSIVSDIFNSIFGFFTDLFRQRISHDIYVPMLHNMGTIKGDFDIDYESIKDGFGLQVDRFQLTTDHFEINAKGTARNSGQGGGDIYDLKARFTNYPFIVDSLVAYVNRVTQRAGRTFFISGKKLTISRAVSERIKFFLREVSDDPGSASNNLSLTAVNKDGGRCPAVGHYSNQEFCSAWSSFVFNIVFMEITRNLNPKEMSKRLLQAPATIVQAPANIARTILGGLFGSKSTPEQ